MKAVQKNDAGYIPRADMIRWIQSALQTMNYKTVYRIWVLTGGKDMQEKTAQPVSTAAETDTGIPELQRG